MDLANTISGAAAPILDPFGLRHSSNPVLARIGDPLGLLPIDEAQAEALPDDALYKQRQMPRSATQYQSLLSQLLRGQRNG